MPVRIPRTVRIEEAATDQVFLVHEPNSHEARPVLQDEVRVPIAVEVITLGGRRLRYGNVELHRRGRTARVSDSQSDRRCSCLVLRRCNKHSSCSTAATEEDIDIRDQCRVRRLTCNYQEALCGLRVINTE